MITVSLLKAHGILKRKEFIGEQNGRNSLLMCAFLYITMFTQSIPFNPIDLARTPLHPISCADQLQLRQRMVSGSTKQQR